MSFFGFFGKSAAEKKTKAAAAAAMEDNSSVIATLRDQAEMLERRNKHIKGQQTALVAEAKIKVNAGDKKGALLLLQKKKKIEAEIEKNQGTQLLLDNQLSALECATMNKQVIDVLMIGNNTIKKINKNMSPEKIDELMDDIQEENDNYRLIQEAMSHPVQQIYDDDDLLAELEKLSAEDEDDDAALAELLDVADVPNLSAFPAVPTTTPAKIRPVARKSEEEEEEDDIAKEMRILEAMIN